MTSLILAQKLGSISLTKEEFEKIKNLKITIAENSLKVGRQLKKVIDKQEVDRTCRLCLKPGTRNVFDIYNNIDVVVSIRQFLGVQVKENDGKPQHICNTCASILRDTERLKQTAEITEWRLQQELEMVANIQSELDAEESLTSHGGCFVEKQGKIERRWCCGKCKRTFNDQEEFIDHEKQPSCRRLKLYVCETCGMKLKTMTRFKRHRLIHTGELRHACPLCPYRGRTLYALSVHGRTHTGARPLRCGCGAQFPSASGLASHRRRHRPPAYACPYCGKRFRFNEVLRNHIASQHSTARPHVCDTCGKAFSTRKMVCRHERRVHNRPKMRSGILPTYLQQQDERPQLNCILTDE